MKNNRKNRKLLAIRLKNTTGTKVGKRTMFKLVKWHNNFRNLMRRPSFVPLDDSSYYPNHVYRHAALTYDMIDVYGSKNAVIYPTSI